MDKVGHTSDYIYMYIYITLYHYEYPNIMVKSKNKIPYRWSLIHENVNIYGKVSLVPPSIFEPGSVELGSQRYGGNGINMD